MSLKMTFKVVDRDLGWRQIKANIKSSDSKGTVVGIFDGQISEYAHHNEFGSPRANIPKRPFMRMAFDLNREKYFKMIAALYADLATPGPKDIARLLIRLGTEARNDIIKSISQGNWRSNSPSTVDAKGSSKPLVDTGAMQRAITFFTGKVEAILKK